MSTLTRTRIRLTADAACFDAPLDIYRRATPQFWRGNDVQFEIAVFFQGVLQDVSNLASITLEIRAMGADGNAPDPSSTPLMGETVTTFDNTTTSTTWASGAQQQAVIAFSAAESNIAAGPAWLSLFVVTTDSPGRVITLCAGSVRVLEDGSGLATTPQPVSDTFYTAVESDARFALIGGGSGSVTSVGLTLPGIFSVAGSPITSSGTLAATWVNQNANFIFAGPGSGSAAAPTFRALLAADIPALAQSGVTGLTSTLALLAPLASPALTGTPTAPTVGSATDNTTKVATTAFVQAAITAAGGGSGTVTSVALTLPGIFSISGSPVTTAGTLAASLATQSANLVLAGPSSGSASVPTFRTLVAADIPAIAQSGVTGLTTALSLLAPSTSPSLTGDPTITATATTTVGGVSAGAGLELSNSTAATSGVVAPSPYLNLVGNGYISSASTSVQYSIYVDPQGAGSPATSNSYLRIDTILGGGGTLHALKFDPSGNLTIAGSMTAVGASLSGTCTATTVSSGDNSTNIATTAMVQSALSGIVGTVSPIKNGSNLVCVGDSLTYGSGSSNPATKSYPAQMQNLPFMTGRSSTVINLGVAGWTLSNLVSDYSTHVHPYAPNTSGNPPAWLFINIGTNDLTSSTVPATWVASLDSYIATAHADGFIVVLFDIQASAEIDSNSANGVRNAVNVLLQQDPNPDYFVQISTLFNDDTPSSAWYDSSGTHHTDAGIWSWRK